MNYPKINKTHLSTIIDIIKRCGEREEYREGYSSKILATAFGENITMVVTFDYDSCLQNEFQAVETRDDIYRFEPYTLLYGKILQWYERISKCKIKFIDKYCPIPEEEQEKFITALRGLYDKDDTGLTKRAIMSG